MKPFPRLNLYILFFFFIIKTHPADAACPDTILKETLDDCPWAEVTRLIDQENKNCVKIFKKNIPFIFKQFNLDKKTDTFISLWGEAKNFDDNAKAQIVTPTIIQCLAQQLKVKKPLQKQDNFDTVHAGLQHTYAYLFSNLMTPYGFKRARWTKDDLEKGFNLPAGTLTPKTQTGAFLTNVTYLFAQFSFLDQPQLIEVLKKEGLKNKNLSEEIIKLSAKEYEIKNLKETLAQGDYVVNTTFIKFKNLPSSTQNTHLLIYWIEDLNLNKRFFITGFPVENSFVIRALDPKNLGDNKPISLRYNAWVPALSNSKETLIGKRELF